jgi:L-rhamnonate dehydratase
MLSCRSRPQISHPLRSTLTIDSERQRKLMKITEVEAIHLRVEDPNIGLFDGSYDDCLLVVHTDEGITGIGETESLAPAIQGLVRGPSAHIHARALREVLIGCDPSVHPSEHWQRMYDATDYIGRRGLAMHAIGGIDLALWDLYGKIKGQPVHALIGGARRDRIPAYGTIYPISRTEDGVRRQVEAARAKNLKAFKLCADPWWMDDLALTRRLLLAARACAACLPHLRRGPAIASGAHRSWHLVSGSSPSAR